MAQELQPRGHVALDTVPRTEVAHTENDLVPTKVIQDLQEGFRITHHDENGVEGWGFVVTRLDEDLFVVEVNMGTFAPHPGFPDDTFVRKYFTIRRKARLDGPGSATREVWKKHITNRPGNFSETPPYRIQRDKGGELEEAAFWEKYNNSAVDAEKTQELYDIHETRLKEEKIKRIRDNTRMNWVVDEQSDDHSLDSG